jgi:hypothetical protein
MATKEVIKPEIKELEKSLAVIRGNASAVIVKSADDYAKAGAALVMIDNYTKDVKLKLEPFVVLARRNYEAARAEMQKYLNAAEEIRAKYSAPMTEFKRQERLAAEAEQRKINEQRQKEANERAAAERALAERLAEEKRKEEEKEIRQAVKGGELSKTEAEKMKKEAAARQEEANREAAEAAARIARNVEQVTVRPNVPTVAGTRSRVNWKFKIVDRSKIPVCFMSPDEKLIGQMVRDYKDKARSEAFCPGIEVYTEDSI